MKNIRPRFLILLFSLVPMHSYTMTPGTLDPSFGGDPAPGLVTTDLGGTDVAYALVRQPDHKLVAAGTNGVDFELVRYLPNGDLDPSFGIGGIVTTNIGGTNDQAHALIIQPDGKLVAAGRTGSVLASSFALARYLPNGTLDPSFGPGGTVVTSINVIDSVNALILQPDGGLVVAGRSGPALNIMNFTLARYLPNGTLDPSFGFGGIVITPFGASVFNIANALLIQADGKLVAAGQTGSITTSDFALARYLPNGTLDPSFGGTPAPGLVTTDFGTIIDSVNALIIQSDGKLVAAGQAGTLAAANFALASYLANGSLDPSFGGNPAPGLVITDFNGGPDIARALVIQPDGKLVAAGQTETGTNRFALARYFLNGSLDPSFGGNPAPGLVTTDFNGGSDIARALVIQTEGTHLKLVAAGEASGDFGLAQYFAVNNISLLASAVIAKYC